MDKQITYKEAYEALKDQIDQMVEDLNGELIKARSRFESESYRMHAACMAYNKVFTQKIELEARLRAIEFRKTSDEIANKPFLGAFRDEAE